MHPVHPTHLPALTERPFGSLTLFSSDLVQVGITRCPATHADFEDPGPVSSHTIVFPETTVRVERPGMKNFVSSPNQVVFHPRGQAVRRVSVANAGDDHVWFGTSTPTVCSVLTDVRPRSADEPEAPFGLDQGPCDATSFLVQQALVRELLRGDEADALRVEETFLRLLHHVTRLAHDQHERAVAQDVSPSSRRAREELCDRGKAYLAERFRLPASLSDIARALSCSEFHLTRTFGRTTGLTLHRYRNRLRLARALVRVLDGELDLSDLALRLGFSTHSHMTASFRKAFGLTPSEARSSAAPDATVRVLLDRALDSLDLPERPDCFREV
jgi:AraC-like DNA-binding protein